MAQRRDHGFGLVKYMFETMPKGPKSQIIGF